MFVYRDIDACSRHTKSAQKIAVSDVLMYFGVFFCISVPVVVTALVVLSKIHGRSVGACENIRRVWYFSSGSSRMQVVCPVNITTAKNTSFFKFLIIPEDFLKIFSKIRDLPKFFSNIFEHSPKYCENFPKSSIDLAIIVQRYPTFSRRLSIRNQPIRKRYSQSGN